jgi:hypothetical protein
MMRPDEYYAIMSILKYASVLLALNFAGRIVVLVVRHIS